VNLATTPIRVISSMATRRLLADLIAKFETASPHLVSLESVGGLDAARRVRAGEALDVVVLARDVIDDLIGTMHIVTGSRVDVAVSAIAARTVGYSTGPSGQYLARLFASWDPDGRLRDRITVAPVGVPVGSLVARGDIELGFQQLSELGGDGIEVVGPLPSDIQMMTTFSGGVALTSTQPDAARALLTFMARPALTEIKRAHGMDAA
jgi:molybdate transport system substrate-binding protein